MISASEPQAWGKVILLGEHSVVYGHQALAGAIDRGVRCYGVEGSAGLSLPDWNLEVSLDSEHPVALAYAAILRATGAHPRALRGESNLPCAAGLGSSAALSVAIARVLRPSASREEIASFASAGEQHFHNSPSGVDVALSVAGGIGTYTKAAGLQPLTTPPLRLVIGLSGVKRNTAAQVDIVKRRIEEDPAARGHIESLGQLCEDGSIALQQRCLEQLGDLMNQCHEHLCKLGVSTDKLDQMVHAARAAGAFGAKLTGAGGGGAIICLAPNHEDRVGASLRELGFDCFTAEMGVTQ